MNNDRQFLTTVNEASAINIRIPALTREDFEYLAKTLKELEFSPQLLIRCPEQYTDLFANGFVCCEEKPQDELVLECVYPEQ